MQSIFWPTASPNRAKRRTERVELFHLDSVACGLSALAYGTNAPNVLRREALDYELPPGSSGRHGTTLFGSRKLVPAEKAVAANSSAVREWDSNGTNFGYDPERGHTAGEFGHNDFYPVVVAAAQIAGCDGRRTLKAMLLLDEIRGRLAEVFSLKSYKIDHVVHGAIASAIVYGVMLGANVDQLESAVGLVVAHYIPFRAIRHGKQLSDSKGASAAISSEAAVLSARRALRGFVGPADIFRNAEAIFCLFEKPAAKGESPFDLDVGLAGDEFTILGMHFKLGLYEHQSAGAIQGLMELLAAHPTIVDDEAAIRSLRITIYQPAFDIIGDPAKRDPQTRQSADHSMVYIIATLLRKAIEQRTSGWKELMLLPDDYDDTALRHPLTRRLMERIDFRHGGHDYDARYPDGIPTSLEIEHTTLGRLAGGLVMYPEGHARNRSGNLAELLAHKFGKLAGPAVDDVAALRKRFTGLRHKSAEEIRTLYDFQIRGVE
ncbi:MAG: MmgE/PrpD family protein [Pirellulales bacterium]